MLSSTEQTNGTTQMRIHLVDGTYELFRSNFGAPRKKAPDGRDVGAEKLPDRVPRWISES